MWPDTGWILTGMQPCPPPALCSCRLWPSFYCRVCEWCTWAGRTGARRSSWRPRAQAAAAGQLTRAQPLHPGPGRWTANLLRHEAHITITWGPWQHMAHSFWRPLLEIWTQQIALLCIHNRLHGLRSIATLHLNWVDVFKPWKNASFYICTLQGWCWSWMVYFASFNTYLLCCALSDTFA